MKLDTDEKEILDSFDSGEWRSLEITDRERKRYGQYAEATFRKDRRVNIRISRKDLEAIQKRALTEGLPYQTLISSVLHKYAAGRLVDNSNADFNHKQSRSMEPAETPDEQLRFAIANRRLIEVTYGGSLRIAEPYDYGLRKNTATLVMYQLRTSGVPEGKSNRGWRLLDVSKIEALTVLSESFSGGRDKSTSQIVVVNEMFSPATGEPASRALRKKSSGPSHGKAEKRIPRHHT